MSRPREISPPSVQMRMEQNFGPHMEQKCAVFAGSADSVSSWYACAVSGSKESAGLRISEALAITREDVTVTQDSLAVTVRAEHSKTHRGRTVLMLDSRCKWFWLERVKTIGPGDPLIPALGDKHSHWRTDNAVKACAALYKDIGGQLEDEAVSSMRSHAWRTVLNNRAIARGVPAEIRSAFFGHTEAMNVRNYTDLIDVSAMQSALEGGALDGALGG